MNLRQKLIRLAYNEPRVRNAVLPLLKKGYGETVMRGPHMRMTYSYQGITVQELPSKPFKRQLRKFRLDNYYLVQSLGIHEFLSENLTAKVREGMTYDQVVRTLKNAWKEAVEYVLTDIIEKPKSEYLKLTDADLEHLQDITKVGYEDTVHYLEVTPNDTDPIVVSRDDFYLESKWTSFTATQPDQNDYQQADPYYSNIVSKSPGGARKLYLLLKANPGLAQKFTESSFMDFLTKNKIPYRYESSSWR